jgi:pimeloyl-ACP methyl ester carboxylesterase
VEVHHAPWSLADRYRVVAPDLPGFGFAEVPSSDITNTPSNEENEFHSEEEK